MAQSAPAYPYETRLNILYPPMEVIDEKALADACEYKWFNQTLCKVNDSVVRVGIIEGEYHWHKHDNDDEFFYVVEGKLLLDFEDRTVELSPRQGFVVPKGVVHRTRAPQRTVILMVEGAGIVAGQQELREGADNKPQDEQNGKADDIVHGSPPIDVSYAANQ